MIDRTPAVLSVVYACVLYFCICTCPAQLSMFHMERRSRNTLIIVIVIIVVVAVVVVVINILEFVSSLGGVLLSLTALVKEGR